MCWLCDYWWILLAALALIAAMLLSRNIWSPLLGVSQGTPESIYAVGTPTLVASNEQPVSYTVTPLSIAQAVSPTSSLVENMQQSGYINTQGGYALNYPAQWQGTEMEADVQFSTQQGAMAYVHVESSVQDINTFIETTQGFSYDVLQTIKTSIAGQPARCIETALPGSTAPTAISCFVLDGQKGFVISLTEMDALNQDQLQIIQAQFMDLLSSFHFTKTR